MSSQPPTSVPTPTPSSPPPPSESFLSDLDGTAPSILDTSFGQPSYDIGKIDGGALNLVSWKLDVNARSEDGVEKRGFNAISTVLNHPTKKANPLRSTRKPLPPLPFTPPILQKPPPPSHYDPYLQSITPLYDSFIASQSHASSAIPNDLNIRSNDLPSLEGIPSMFFDNEFNLSNPSTWSDLISSSSSSSNPNFNMSLGDTLPDNEGLQDNLSTYLDILERHLVVEISKKSNSFFSALTNLQDLNSESNSCLNNIKDLQESLKEINEKQSQKGLKVIAKQDELHNLKIIDKNLGYISELNEEVGVIKRLEEEEDWQGSLSYLEDIVKWWNKFGMTPTEGKDSAGSSTLPLSTLPAFSTLPSTIDDLTIKIATQLENALSAHLLSTLSRETEEMDKSMFGATVEPMLAGLVRCGKVEAVDNVWRDAVTISIREGSRNVTSLAQSLQAMDHSSFLLLSTQMYRSLTARIKLSQEVGEEIERVLKSIISLPRLSLSESSSPAPEPTIPDLNDAIISGCELAHTRASKILAVRAEQHASLGLEEFVEIFRENWEFILSTEKIAGKMIVGLRGVTASQARSFLVTYHSIRLTKSAKLVEEEQWTQIDVSPNVQHVVNLLIQSAVSDPPECTIPPPPSQPKENGEVEAEGAVRKQIDIEDKNYFVVKATSESLVLLGDYLKIVINLELVVTDVMSRIIEFLKSFNSRTCQVVLGAGAMRSAGLKNITAKHLALASQSLSIIISLTPYIREFVRRHLSPKQAVMLTEFDKLKRDYQEHQNEIHAKLVAIMSDRLAVHVGSLREIDWEATPSKDGPRPYAEMLVKETATLHKVLSKYLAAATVDAVMSEVISAIVHRLSEEYGKIEFKSEEAKKRILQDVALISIRLTPLSESGKEVSKLETVVKEKPTPRKPIGQAMSGFLRRNGSQKGVSSGEVDEEVKEQEGDEDEDGEGLTGGDVKDNQIERQKVEGDKVIEEKTGEVFDEKVNGEPAGPTEETKGAVESDEARKADNSPSAVESESIVETPTDVPDVPAPSKINVDDQAPEIPTKESPNPPGKDESELPTPPPPPPEK
uniref:Vacuolar protein sorting-associated protein 54 C-terminal domain-containing protein n=1 Tax=Kwoniella bestiolae CBS 10118 TaxID=1296100 RepID=A0A1B9GED4_9TREE|nr:hypothetical protein I302_00879 [Kwoniella bestiolae CBS 10118]OCF29377.1 hypothetical protein I302_00879 [Kwoniella bestiolae CBS 10118]